MKVIEKAGMSVFFSSLIAVWHALFFNVRVNSRVVFQPWLLQRGFAPYLNIGDEHAPLLPQALSWLQPFFGGDALLTARFIHAALIWMIVGVCVWIVFDRGGRWAALACGAYFFAMSYGLGFWAMWYDLAVAPIFLAAFIVITSKRIPFSVKMLFIGLLSGIGFLVKQHAVLLSLIVPIALAVRTENSRNVWISYVKPVLIGLFGFLVPVFSYILYYYLLTKELYAIWYWLILYNIVGGYSELGAKLPTLAEIRGILPIFIMIVPFVLVTMGFSRVPKMRRLAADRWWLLFFMLVAASMLYPRYSTMHWATMLPFLAMASGLACADLLSHETKELVSVFRQWGFYLAIVGVLWLGRGVLFYVAAYQDREARILIEYDGLPELADQIEDITDLGSVVLFPDDEGVGNLYYLLEKVPPHFWIMNYPWFRNDYEISRWIAEMDAAQPDQVIYFASRGPQNYSEMNSYIFERYETVHVLEWNGQKVEIMEQR